MEVLGIIKKEWRTIRGFSLYEVSNYGEVRKVKDKKIISQREDRDGYKHVGIYNDYGVRKDLRVHRLVAIEFIDNPYNKPVVNHLNENVRDNHVSNLQWATYKENSNHGTLKERQKKARKDNINTINYRVVRISMDGNIIGIYDSVNHAHKETGVRSDRIAGCCRGKYKTAGYSMWQYILPDKENMSDELF